MAETATTPSGLLVFIHVPKTAGTTLRTVLNMNEPGTRSRALGNVFKGGGGVSTALIERLRSDGGIDLKGVKLLRGHIPLGVRDYLPRSLPSSRRIRYFTFLRDPVDRLLSHYFRIRESGGGYGLPPLPDNATIDDLLAGGYIHDNLHTRMLCGQPEPFGEVTDEMLEQAKRNLTEGLAFFGLTERFDESLVLARRRLGLRTILYRTSGRINASRPRGDEIPADLRAAAERCNRYDIELYEHATAIFESAPEHDELEFQVEVAAFAAAKGRGKVDADGTPPPSGFGGDEQAWRLLLEARADVLRMQFELARQDLPRGSKPATPRRTAARLAKADPAPATPPAAPEPAVPDAPEEPAAPEPAPEAPAPKGEPAPVAQAAAPKGRAKGAKQRAKGEGKRAAGKPRAKGEGKRTAGKPRERAKDGTRRDAGAGARRKRRKTASSDRAGGGERG